MTNSQSTKMKLLKSVCYLLYSNFIVQLYIFITSIVLQVPELQAQIVIGNHGEYIKWNDCLYGKLVIPENDVECHKCSLDASRPSIPSSITHWPQEFFNCTDSCEYRTICTKLLYYISEKNDDTPVLRPLCYQCGIKKDEVVWFDSKYEYELCSIDCRGCAVLVDIADAARCAPVCQGYPTFCYPAVKTFDQRICYQATHWYGCKYIDTNLIKPENDTGLINGENEMRRNLTEECRQCALLVEREEEARHCSYACSWYPTYHKTGVDNITRFYQCRPYSIITDKHNQLFLYNIPEQIMEYLHMSNASFVYPPNLVSGHEIFLNGPVTRQVNGKFEIGRMNYPLPYIYRLQQENQ